MTDNDVIGDISGALTELGLDESGIELITEIATAIVELQVLGGDAE